jgi:TPR repeat protein
VLSPPDLGQARHWYEKAAEAGEANAMVNLGLMLADHRDPADLDVEQARHWFHRVAEVGNTKAMVWLGSLLVQHVEPPEVDHARHWL